MIDKGEAATKVVGGKVRAFIDVVGNLYRIFQDFKVLEGKYHKYGTVRAKKYIEIYVDTGEMRVEKNLDAHVTFMPVGSDKLYVLKDFREKKKEIIGRLL